MQISTRATSIPSPGEFELLGQTAQRAIAYLRGIDARSVAPAAAAVRALDQLAGPLPAAATDPGTVIELLDSVASPATVANAGGRYFGFVNGGSLPAALAAAWLVNTWDQNGGLRVMSPASATLEEIALAWVKNLLGLPADCGAGLVTGATMANLAGLAAARHQLLTRAGWDVENDGLFGAPPLQVVVGEEVHASIIKALGLLGLGRTRVSRVPVDSEGRMRADRLPGLNDHSILCLQAGNVASGAFDPAAELIPVAQAARAWVHVDGAFGLWAAASARHRHLLRGFEQADSWATDAHKWPNVGYDCGIALVRNAAALQSVMAISAPYVMPGKLREPHHYTPEMSRRARGVELWAALRSLGREGVEALVDRTCAHARQMADALRAAGFEILNDVVINQVLVSFGSPEKTRSVIERLQQEGTCWCGGTEWQGRTAMRISISSWATTEEDIDLSLAAMVRIARAPP
ncbi:MAG TPA: pyridoxal-dependent decarboxylase [Steroidobacteraceae bacterium]|jgi:glutamate/tyrosine decarboxylase-like PLP-dependent enzyme